MIKVKAKCIKCNFKNGDYRIFNWSPIGNYEELKLSNYMTFSTKGNDSYISDGKEYELVLEEISSDSRFGGTYKIIEVPSMSNLDLSNLSKEESFEILMDCTSSERIANNIISAYPNFIELVLTKGKESIDVKNIHGVGDAYLSAYCRNLTEKYKYYAILQHFKEYQLDVADCKTLIDIYSNEDGIEKALSEVPYKVLYSDLGRTFEYSDRLISSIRDDLLESEQRCAYLILSVLERNEQDGDTYLDANDLYQYIMNEYTIAKELEPYIVPCVKNNELFFYDENTKRIAIASTYLGECMIRDLVNDKISNPNVLNIDWKKYTNVDGFQLTEEQGKLLEHFCNYNITCLIGKAGSGKAQPIDTVIPTPNGYKKLGDIKVGDYVYDRLGKPTKVLGVFPQGMKDVYTVELADGRKTQCNDEHLWSYYTSKGNLCTKTLREMIDSGIKNKNIYKYKIPTNNAIEYEEKQYEVDPYIIGSFIGNGCCKEKVLTLSSNDVEQVNMVAELLNTKPIKSTDKNYSWVFENNTEQYNKFGAKIKYMKTSNILPKEICCSSFEKSIPTEYKYGSIEQRYKLLQGLFDTDGYIVNNSPRFSLSYCTTSKKLMEDIMEVLYSLGYSCSVKEDKRSLYRENIKNGHICYYINVLCDNDEKEKFFRLKRKKNIAIKAKKYNKNRNYNQISIVNVKKENYQSEMVCIYVDNDEHLYLTNDYIVTHNTSSVKALVKLMEDNDLSYTLLTPTGASALRVAEQTNRNASTIHRKCLRDGEINSDVIVIDEFGMVSLDVFIMLLNCITNENCKIVLCGDPYQLPSIGKGCVFSDIINSNKVPMAELTKVFRYDTNGGAFVGENVRQGKKFLDNEKVKQDNNTYKIFDNYKFIQTEDIFDYVISEYSKLRKKYKEDEIMILSPYNKGDCGTYRLNNAIELEYNPPKPNEKTMEYKKDNVNIVFRVGSRVVNTKNDYKAMPLDSYNEIENSCGILTENDVPLTQLFNGQIGVVRQVEDNYMVCQFGEELIVITKQKVKNLLLARAISTHRSQGGEWKSVINVVSNLHERNLSKQLLYVACTRAKEFHCDIGDRDTFENSLLVDVIEQRNTWLKELLLEC